MNRYLAITAPLFLFNKHGSKNYRVFYEGSIAKKIAKKDSEACKFIKFCEKNSTKEADIEKADKHGYETNLSVSHPFKKDVKLKIFIANFILMDYGTGAIFGCPAHDQRDYDFAVKYSLDIIPVIKTKESLPFMGLELYLFGFFLLV